MPRKENTKAKTWERDRRKRMNSYFKTLADLLPPHQEGRKRNKMDILIHASKYIKDLHSRTEELFFAHASEAHKEELNRLKKLVTQLFSRTQLLSTLLKEAGISVPAEPALEKLSPLKWSNKINVEDAERYCKNFEESTKQKNSEKRKEKTAVLKVPCKKKPTTSSQTPLKKLSDECTVSSKTTNSSTENQENQENCDNGKNAFTDNVNDANKEMEDEAGIASNNVSSANTLKNSGTQKTNSQKKEKKKTKKKDGKKSTNNTNKNVAKIAPSTLILSGGKLMPLVTPITTLTSSIIVNTSSQQAKPIILGNAQQNQMIVMQPLTNHIQNSVVSLCNQALINTVQKVTLNAVPSIQANVVMDSQNWVSNVKNVINVTKIGNHKVILPKGKEVTKTTMTYKVPIPAVHKEKVEKVKENSNRKENETKNKNKNNIKNNKPQLIPNESAENGEKLEKEKEAQSSDENTEKPYLKRSCNSENDSAEIIENNKKQKLDDRIGDVNCQNNLKSYTQKATDFTATCKSIESLKHVIEKIGEDTTENQQVPPTIVENENKNESNSEFEKTNLPSSNSTNQIDLNSDALNDTLNDTQCPELSEKNFEDVPISKPVSSDSPIATSTDPKEATSISLESVVDGEVKKSASIEPPITKSLTDVDKIVEEAVNTERNKSVCNLDTRFDNLLRMNTKDSEVVDGSNALENNKIILNLDTNTTTTIKPEVVPVSSTSDTNSFLLSSKSTKEETSLTNTLSNKTLPYSSDNTFVPISSRTEGLHSDLSNDIFASLQVPSSSHNPESISPTAAFLMAFPLVSSLNGKTEVLDEEMKEDFKYHSQTPPMLLQIGAMDSNSFKVKTTSSSDEAVVEKRLRTICEEKREDQSTRPENESETIVSTENRETTKALPKVINEETLRGSFKIVQQTSSSNFERSESMFSTINSLPATSVVNPTTNDNSKTVMTSGIINTSNNNTTACSSVDNSRIIPRTCIDIEKNSGSIRTAQHQTNCVDNSSYPNVQELLPTYKSVVCDDLHRNSMILTNSTVQNSTIQNTAIQDSVETSRNPTVNQNDINTFVNSSSSSHTVQERYTKDKNNQDRQIGYKLPLISSDQRIDYTNSRNVQQEFSESLSIPRNTQREVASQSKGSPLPILTSQGVQTVYETQTTDCHGTRQGFGMHEENRAPRNSRHDYSIDHGKNINRKVPMSYSNTHEGNSAQEQNFSSKDIAASSSNNRYQDTYSKGPLNKNLESGNVDRNAELNNVLRSKEQERINGHDENYGSMKKIDVDPFAQTFTYETKDSMNNRSNQNLLNSNVEEMYREKRENTQNYISYSNKLEENKKIGISSMNSISGKSLVQDTSGLRYSQQQTSSYVVTSNYEQSSLSENHGKSTTTVAHNSSNFSILSWTTFSPASGNANNNLVHFDQGTNQNDSTEAKTICENYNYVPLHKENATFSVPTNDTYTNNPNVSNIEKSRSKLGMETQKHSFDLAKTRNVQTNVQTNIQKQDRINHNHHSQNQTSGTNDYKYDTELKNKNKYGLEPNYIQTEYSTVDQQHQLHTSKNHQTVTEKQDKTIYPMSSFDSQVNFDLSESNNHVKYSVDSYASSNFKCIDKTQLQAQHKYQTLSQNQITSLQHDTSVFNNTDNNNKHEQQQQNSNKPKTNDQQQQQAVRAPINWMTTPEIKHNSNITDIILPPIGKELEFCQNNLFGQNNLTYSQGTPNQFYNNYDVTPHGFPNLPVLQTEAKRTVETFYSEEQPFPWSPTKSTVHNTNHNQISKSIDQHVPSSLPPLTGDLDLGTNDKQNFSFAQMPSRLPTNQSKDPNKDKSTNGGNRDYQSVLNTQNVQHSVPSSSFLSVSQLVEHEKAEKSQQQQQHHHQQQQQQQATRKHQRKNNASPRGANKRLDIRKQASSNEQLHQRQEEQKSSTVAHGFSEQSTYQSQQQQKYQQNNVHWRSRNCKSNYTAEALIGTNTSIHDASHQDKHASIKFASNYSQNKFQSLPAAETVMPINYFPNADENAGYGQVVNQNFNSYTYTSNTNIYPTSNFITTIPNTSTGYMMPLHDTNTDYMETNALLLSNVSSSGITSTVTSSTNSTAPNVPAKNHHYGKHQNCDKRSYSTTVKKGKRKGLDAGIQNIEFSLSGINSPLEDYHHSASFLPPHANPLYQNHPQANVYAKTVNTLPPPPPPPPVTPAQAVVATAGFPINSNVPRGGIVSSNPMMSMTHHPSGTSLTNFNLSTIFPEMNDKVTGYKTPNIIPSGLPQPSNHGPMTYAQRSNYATNSLCHLPQVSETTQFGNSVPPPPPAGVIHYKNV